MFKNTEVESGFNFESAFGYAQSSKFALEEPAKLLRSALRVHDLLEDLARLEKRIRH